MRQKIQRLLLLFCASLYLATLHASEVPEFYGKKRSIKVGDVSISYYRFGSGPALLMNTGRGATLFNWTPSFLNSLSEQSEIIIYDYPGVGASTVATNKALSIAYLGDLAIGLSQALKLDQPNVLGWSMGGSIALYMASQHGDKINNVISIGGKAGGERSILPSDKVQQLFTDAAKNKHIETKQVIIDVLFPANQRNEAYAYFNEIKNLPHQAMPGSTMKAQGAAVGKFSQGPGLWPQLPTIKNSLLIINGVDDRITPVDNAKQIAAQIPGAWLTLFKDAGHAVLFQESDRVAALVHAFLMKK